MCATLGVNPVSQVRGGALESPSISLGTRLAKAIVVMSHASPRLWLRPVLVLPAFGAILAFAGSARADEPVAAPLAASGTSVVRPADTHTDPATGMQTVVVPEGCSATTQSSGQVVILCPFREPTAVAAAPRQRLDSKWYGWQVLLVDGATFVTGTVIAAASDGEAAGTGVAIALTGYAIGGPIVHWSNGQVGKGFASLGLRLGAPLVGGLTGLAFGAAMDGGCNAYDGCGGAAVGAGLGVIAGGIAAVVIDSAVLARKQVVVTDDEAKRTTPKLQWVPSGGYDAKRQAATVGISGTF